MAEKKYLIRPDAKVIAENSEAFLPKAEGDFETVRDGARTCTRCVGVTCALLQYDWVITRNSDGKTIQTIPERSPNNCELAEDHRTHAYQLNTQDRSFGFYRPDVQ